MNSIAEIQYAKAGEVLLAYQILGEGEQTLLLVNGFAGGRLMARHIADSQLIA